MEHREPYEGEPQPQAVAIRIRSNRMLIQLARLAADALETNRDSESNSSLAKSIREEIALIEANK